MSHIVFLSPHSDPQAHIGETDSGGQCIYELELGRALSLINNTKVTIYCRKKFNYPETSYINQNFTIKRISCGGDYFIPKEKLDPVLDEFAIKVASDLRYSPPDVVHSHYWDGGKAAILLENYLQESFSVVWTPHSLGSAKRKRFPGIENEKKFNFIPRIAWENYIMLKADSLIVSSDDEKERIIQDYAVDKEKMTIIPPGISTNNLSPVGKQQSRKLLNLPVDARIIMSLGRLDKRKGYHNVIQSLAALNKMYKSDAMLVIFSGNASNRSDEENDYLIELKKLTKDLKLENLVVFRDAVEYSKVGLVYSASDVYLCLSDYEPFGLSILESMLMHTPVIATNNGGPINIIKHKVSGVLVNVEDYSTIAEHLYSLLQDSSFRNEIIDNAYSFVVNNYAWSVRAREFYEIYMALNSGKLISPRQYARIRPIDTPIFNIKPIIDLPFSQSGPQFKQIALREKVMKSDRKLN